MEYDAELDIATGLSAKSRKWKNETWLWSQLVQKLYDEHKTYETYSEFTSATKTEQLKIKDVGGYVGGYLTGGRRKPENVLHRQLITLDVDHAHMDFWDDFTLQFNETAVLHSTHSHTPENPRFRLIMPLSREVSPDEYVAISRYIAGALGIELFDNTTFETNRLMFWPSNPQDVDYYYRFQEGPWLDADGVLDTYVDWTDSTAWPTAQREIKGAHDASKKQADPREKKGVVGAFCRTYGIDEAIEAFLTEEYTPAGEDRYTYRKGSTAAGLTVYDNVFAYSHHGTDPCGGQLCNAFDLVRIHTFGHEDADSENEKKSFARMEEMAREDPATRKTLVSEKIIEAKYEFAETEDAEEPEVDWATDLEVNNKGKYLSTADNINIILANDQRLKAKFRRNDFDGLIYVFGDLPWRKVTPPEPIKDVDYAGVRNYIGAVYEIKAASDIMDSLMLEIQRHSFHPVREYLNSLKWDGERRIDSLLIDFMGTADSVYSREAIRKTMVAAVARVFEPGCKFDLVLTLVGAQGTGKSTLVRKLGRQWFSDTFMTVQGKEAFEQIQGSWVIEMAELSGLRKAEVETIKHFISKQEDKYRPPYTRVAESFKRQCVFIGTTNSEQFLRDPSGNRRFMPISLNPARMTKDVFTDLDPLVDQLWAEAVALYMEGESLFLSPAAKLIAEREQGLHSEVDDRRGLIEQYLDMKLPDSWDDLDLFARRTFLEEPGVAPASTYRDYVCIAEIWCECLSKPKEDMTRYNTRGINDIMRDLPDWEPVQSTRDFPIYGRQRYYKRKLD